MISQLISVERDESLKEEAKEPGEKVLRINWLSLKIVSLKRIIISVQLLSGRWSVNVWNGVDSSAHKHGNFTTGTLAHIHISGTRNEPQETTLRPMVENEFNARWTRKIVKKYWTAIDVINP